MKTYQLDNILQRNSSNGRLYKQFVGDVLIKTGSIHENQFEQRFNYEAIGEYIVYNICKYLNIPEKIITPYKLCKVHIKNTVGCECKLFTRGSERYLSFYHLARVQRLRFDEMQGINSYNQIVSIYKNALKHTKNDSNHLVKFLNTMFIVDSLVLNSDRHLGNFGFIINESGCIVREAPIFDNGNSFFCNKPFENIQYSTFLNNYISQRPIAKDFDYIFEIIDITKISGLLDYVEGLCTRLVTAGILPQNRADFIIQALQSRVDTLKTKQMA